TGRAFLAGSAECRAHDPFGRFVEVGLARHDGGILAAHLDDHRLWMYPGEILVEVEADFERAGEDDPVDAVVLLELRTDRRAGAHDHVEHAVGDARVAHRLRPWRAAPRTPSGAR